MHLTQIPSGDLPHRYATRRAKVNLSIMKKLIAAPVTVLLKKHGFKKNGMTFTAMQSGVTLIVGIQSSTGSTQDSLKVTCNVAIQIDQLSTGTGASVWDAHWRKRIGFFMPEPYDHWWGCKSEKEADRVGQEIATLLESQALPKMMELASPFALATLWTSGVCPGLTEMQRVENLRILTAAGVVNA